MAQTVKDPPTVQETWVRSLGQDDPLGKRMACKGGVRMKQWRQNLTGSESGGRVNECPLHCSLYFYV